MMTLHSKPLAAGILLIVVAFASSCGQPPGAEAELTRLREEADHKEKLQREIQAESDALGDLGAYQNPRPAQLNQLRDHAQQLRAVNTQLRVEKERAARELSDAKDQPPSSPAPEPR